MTDHAPKRPQGRPRKHPQFERQIHAAQTAEREARRAIGKEPLCKCLIRIQHAQRDRRRAWDAWSAAGYPSDHERHVDSGAWELDDRLLPIWKVRQSALDRTESLSRQFRLRCQRGSRYAEALAAQIAHHHTLAQHAAAAMGAELCDWLETLATRAAEPGQTGEAFDLYVEHVWQAIVGFAYPKLTLNVAVLYLSRRALGPRRESRAYAKQLFRLLEKRRDDGRPIPAHIEAIAEAARQNCPGKGSGDDVDVEGKPDYDHALLMAYERGKKLRELFDYHPAADKGCHPDYANDGNLSRTVYSNEPAVLAAINRARRRRDISAQALQDLHLLAFYFPWLAPPAGP